MIKYLPKYLLITVLLIGATGICIESSTLRTQSQTEESSEKTSEENVLIINEKRFIDYGSIIPQLAHFSALTLSNTTTRVNFSLVLTRLYIKFRSILL